MRAGKGWWVGCQVPPHSSTDVPPKKTQSAAPSPAEPRYLPNFHLEISLDSPCLENQWVLPHPQLTYFGHQSSSWHRSSQSWSCEVARCGSGNIRVDKLSRAGTFPGFCVGMGILTIVSSMG